MKPAPYRERKIIADLHVHIRKGYNLEKLLPVLSRGITGLTEVKGNSNILTYNDVIEMHGVKEINKGSFAKICYKEKTGYVVKTQEVLENNNDFHILAIGCNKIIDAKDSKEAIEKINLQGKTHVITHPYVRPSGKWPIKYRIINNEEKNSLKGVCNLTNDVKGEVEIYNGQNICAIPLVFNGALDMRKANKKAEESIKEYKNIKGVSFSDTHSRLDQVHTSVIYLPNDTISLEALTFNLQNKNFETYKQPVNKFSFSMGHFFPSIKII